MVFQVPYNKSKMLFQRRSASINWIRLAQLAFATLSLLAACAILGTAARTFHVFQSQKASNNPWWLPLWPGHFDVTGTKVYLGTSSAVILLSIIYLALHLVPSVSTRPKLGALLTLGVSFITILLAVSAIAVNNLLDKSLNKNGKDSIKTWTCRFQHAGQGATVVLAGGKNMSNDGFATICKETMFDFWGMCGILLVQTALLATAGLQWWRGSTGIGMNQKASSSDINLS